MCLVSPRGSRCPGAEAGAVPGLLWGSELRRWATQRGRPAVRPPRGLRPCPGKRCPCDDGPSGLHLRVVGAGVVPKELAAPSPVPGGVLARALSGPLLRASDPLECLF